MYPISQSFDGDQLLIGHIPVEKLLALYGSPLYVLDYDTLEHQCRSFTSVMEREYSNSQVLYAGKANLTMGIASLMSSFGLGIDVVSGGELITALRAGVSPDNMIFHGNNKSLEELRVAVRNNIRIVLDNQQELTHITSILDETNDTAKVWIRVKPGIEAHTHSFIQTGQSDSKFGIEADELVPFVRDITADPRFSFLGLHAHIGSQIFDIAPYVALSKRMVEFMVLLRDECGIECLEIDLGGGIGVAYTTDDDPPSIDNYLTQMLRSFKEACHVHELTLPKVFVEPGRSIMATAGMTLYTVGTIKNIPEMKTYAFVDGGMADNPRPIIYGSEYSILAANKLTKPKTHTYSIAGKFCESGDILAENVLLPELAPEDVLVFFGTGAYNYSMASNYNRVPRPAMVLVKDGQGHVLVRRESMDDLLRLDEAWES